MARKAQPKKSYAIFISHSSKDNFIAKQIEKLIGERCGKLGVKTFLDERDLKGGDNIAGVIKKNIIDCDELVVCISRYSIESSWVTTEIGAAWVLGKRIVAIIDKVTPEEMPNIIVDYKAVDLNDDFDKYLEELADRVKGTAK
ncbi:MAG: toll/interleukin-1 receptor domain-containing protein [Acidobacteriota bacterium]|nr:toll/interleukin-1 receptor domain-containing protein [Acidobacteriota bacterium]